MVLIVALMIVVKGLVIPSMLRRAMRAANIVDRTLRPTVGYVPSLRIGTTGTVVAVVLAGSLPLLPEHAGTLLVPGSLASLLTGMVLLVGRTRAISQVCGYLILENGVYLFGLLLIRSMPHLLELGILMDVTVGVFIIGIIVDRIQRAFDSQDTSKLTTLQE
jgi:hydrogenase-4 component E